MNQKLKEKTREALTSVLPVTLIVLALSVFVVPTPTASVVMFMTGAALLIVGIGFFSLGADIAMMPMGEGIGARFTKMKRMGLIIPLAFVMGFMITVAEPDLEVLAKQVASIPDTVLIGAVAAGVGLFLIVAFLRVLLHIPLSRLLLIFYAGLLLLSFFVPKEFLAVAFDSGGVTTGPITVPFILALGIGLASLRSDKASHDDSFGLVALCSVGPVLAVMLLGIMYRPQDAGYARVVLPQMDTMQDVFRQFALEFPSFAKEVLLALAPVCGFFLIYQLISKQFTAKNLAHVLVGILYTFIGLVLFLTGVNVGFIPVGNLLGSELATGQFPWLLIPLGMIVGYFIVAAEPAVLVLNKQVEEVSNGTVPAKAMKLCMSVGVAVSVGLSMTRVLTGISILWLLIPGYALALILSFFVPKIYTGIAFDSGGVASGPMTTTFLLPFAMGACEAVGGDILTDAFGVVAMVAMTPLIAIQLMGFIYKKKLKTAVETGTPDDGFEALLDGKEAD
jgi:hypothetical protein